MGRLNFIHDYSAQLVEPTDPPVRTGAENSEQQTVDVEPLVAELVLGHVEGEHDAEKQAAEKESVKAAKVKARLKGVTLKDKGKDKASDQEKDNAPEKINSAKSSRRTPSTRFGNTPKDSSKQSSGIRGSEARASIHPAAPEPSKKRSADAQATIAKRHKSDTRPDAVQRSIWSFQYPRTDEPFVSDRDAYSHMYRQVGGPTHPLLEVDKLEAAELYKDMARNTTMVCSSELIFSK